MFWNKGSDSVAKLQLHTRMSPSNPRYNKSQLDYMGSTGHWICIFVRWWSSGLTPFVPYFLLFIFLTLIKILTMTTKHSLRFRIKELVECFKWVLEHWEGGQRKRPYGDNSVKILNHAFGRFWKNVSNGFSSIERGDKMQKAIWR